LQIQETFEDFDEAGEGEIGTDDLDVVMKSLGLDCTEEELANMIAEVDVDGGGTLDFPEFLLMMCDKMAGPSDLTVATRPTTVSLTTRLNSGLSLLSSDASPSFLRSWKKKQYKPLRPSTRPQRRGKRRDGWK